MGWPEVMADLERRLEGTFQGTYRPLDNAPFFRVQYPPAEEREALHQFELLADRLRQQGLPVECLSLSAALGDALSRLLNAPAAELPTRLQELEGGLGRERARERLEMYLPGELAGLLRERLEALPRRAVAILTRTGCLYPFLRTTALEAELEGLRCALVLAYPGAVLGALLDARPADPRAPFYRGDTIAWQ